MAKITPENLFGNIGGIFGILIGASIMSIGEIIEFFYYMIYIILKHGFMRNNRKLRTKKKDIDKEVNWIGIVKFDIKYENIIKN